MPLDSTPSVLSLSGPAGWLWLTSKSNSPLKLIVVFAWLVAASNIPSKRLKRVIFLSVLMAHPSSVVVRQFAVWCASSAVEPAFYIHCCIQRCSKHEPCQPQSSQGKPIIKSLNPQEFLGLPARGRREGRRPGGLDQSTKAQPKAKASHWIRAKNR